MFGRHVVLPSSSIVEMVAVIRALDAMPQMMTTDMAPRTSDVTSVRGTAALVSKRTQCESPKSRLR